MRNGYEKLDQMLRHKFPFTTTKDLPKDYFGSAGPRHLICHLQDVGLYIPVSSSITVSQTVVTAPVDTF